MINQLTFINQQWSWYVLGIGLILWFLFIWKERRHPNSKSKQYLNIIIALVGVISLSLIILQPAILKDKGNSKLIILTSGFDKTQLDSLNTVYKKIKIIDYKSDVSLFKSTEIPSEVFVLGYGIDPFNLYQLEHIKTTFLKGQPVTGIIQLKHENKLVIGQEFELKGYYNKPKTGHVLALTGPGDTVLDSLVIKDTLSLKFQLNTKLNAKGTFLYHLIEKDSLGELISQDPLPINVIARTPLQVLILNGFPTFETKYLKNYLAEMGHQVVVRSQVTKGKFKYEYFNLETKPIIQLTEDDLNIFDLLIVDSKSLQNLSNTSFTALESAVETQGLGVLIQPDTNYFLSRKSLSKFQFSPTTETEIALTRWSKSKLSIYPYQFNSSLNDIPIQNVGKKVISAYHYLGIGKIGTTTLLNSYNLILKGDKNIYETLWSEIINKVSKSSIQNVEWISKSKLAYIDEPFDFKLGSKVPNPTVKDQYGNIIALKQHIDISTLWEGTTYPIKTGWQSLNIQQDSTELFNFYVSDTSYFNAIKSSSNIIKNQNYFQNDSYDLGTQQYPNPISKIWFYILFLLSFAYLWLQPKL